jgi:hypothetical protein
MVYIVQMGSAAAKGATPKLKTGSAAAKSATPKLKTGLAAAKSATLKLKVRSVVRFLCNYLT